jgi:hypothetical protein
LSRYSRFEREFHAVHGHYPGRWSSGGSKSAETGPQQTVGFALAIGALGLFWSIVLSVAALAGSYVAACFIGAAIGL